MTKLPLNPTKSPTVQAAGTWAYLRNYLPLTTGFIEVEVIPEPDNPCDEHAISFRHDGNVLGYVPRMDTPLLEHYRPRHRIRHDPHRDRAILLHRKPRRRSPGFC